MRVDLKFMRTRIKRVSSLDRNDILEISRHIWEGHDYLPFIIDEWLKDPNSYTYGFEVDDRLVAVANLRLIENGRTGWMEGLRVHPDHRRKGFANVLTERLIKKAEDLGVQRFRYATSTENQASLMLAEKFGFVKVLEMGVFWHPNARIIQSMGSYPHIRKSNPSEVYKLLQGNPHIIPHKVLIYDWKALDSTLEGLETLGKSHEFYIASKAKMDSLSYAYPKRVPERSLWVFTICATEPHGFLSHLSYNIAIALKKGFNAIMGTYEIDFEETLHNVNWGTDERWDTHVVLLEKGMC